MHHNAGLPLTNQHDTLIIGSPKTKSRRDSTAARCARYAEGTGMSLGWDVGQLLPTGGDHIGMIQYHTLSQGELCSLVPMFQHIPTAALWLLITQSSDTQIHRYTNKTRSCCDSEPQREHLASIA